MLFFHWRQEQTELVDQNCEEFYWVHEDVINNERDKLDIFRDRPAMLEDALRKTIEGEGDIENNLENHVLAFPEISSQLNLVNLDANDEPNNNIRLIRLPPLISEENLSTLIKSLNLKQKTFLSHFLYNASLKNIFYEFVGGGAGVGKSRLILGLYQSLTTFYNCKPGCDPSSAKVVLWAPTGKAAYGMNGSTLHAIFSLPINQSGSAFKELGADLLNTVRSNFIDLKVLIIAEISMVGSKWYLT